MPPAAKKNASVILYDVNCESTFQDAAKETLLKIFAFKWFSDSKDCTKLILVNSEESNNQLHRKFSQAPHISEATDVIQFDPNLISGHLEGNATGQANWLIALAVAIEEIKDNYIDDKGAMTLQILFITDFSSQVDELKERRMNFIISSLNTLGIYLYVIGPKVQVPRQMSTVDDVREWAKHLEFIDNNNEQLDTIKKIVQSTKNSLVCDLDVGYHLFINFKNTWGLQAWLVPLTAGQSITFPSITTRFLRAIQPPKIKLQSPTQSAWSWHLVDDVLVEVPFDNVIGGVLKHGKFVPFPSDVEKNFKCYGERGFKLVGFTDRSNISEVYMCGDGSSCVRSDSRIFHLLLDILAQKSKCAIARKIYMKNCKPKLVALLPEPKENMFILVEMPYKENVSMEITEQDVQEAPAIDGPSVQDAYRFLTSLDVTSADKYPLASTLMTPIRLNMMHNLMLKKCTGEASDLMDHEVLQPFDPTPYLQICPPRPTAVT